MLRNCRNSTTAKDLFEEITRIAQMGVLVIHRHVQKRHPASEKPINILLQRLQPRLALGAKLLVHAPQFANQSPLPIRSQNLYTCPSISLVFTSEESTATWWIYQGVPINLIRLLDTANLTPELGMRGARQSHPLPNLSENNYPRRPSPL